METNQTQLQTQPLTVQQTQPECIRITIEKSYATQLLKMFLTAEVPYCGLNNVVVGLVDNGADPTVVGNDAISYAVKANDLLLAKFFMSKGVKPTEVALKIAMEKENQEMIDLILSSDFKIKDKDLLKLVITKGNINTIKKCCTKASSNIDINDKHLNLAVARKDLEVIKFLLDTYIEDDLVVVYDEMLEDDTNLYDIEIFHLFFKDPTFETEWVNA